MKNEVITLKLLQLRGFPCGSACKESACNVEDLGLTPGLGRSPGEGKGYPLQWDFLNEDTIQSSGFSDSSVGKESA